MSRAKKYFRVNVARFVRWQLTLILSPSFSLDSSIFYDILFVKLSENFFYFKLSLICFIYLTRNRFIVVWLHQRSSAIRYANIYVGTDNDTIMKLYNYHRGIKWFASEFRTVEGIYWKDQTNSVNEFMQLTCGNLRHLTFSLLNFRNINFHHSKIRLLKPRSAWILKLKTTWTSLSSCWFLYETLFITFGSFYKFLTNLLSYFFDMNHKTLKRLSIWKQRNERELQFNKFPGFLVKAANLTIFFSFFVYIFFISRALELVVVLLVAVFALPCDVRYLQPVFYFFGISFICSHSSLTRSFVLIQTFFLLFLMSSSLSFWSFKFEE